MFLAAELLNTQGHTAAKSGEAPWADALLFNWKVLQGSHL